MSHSAQLRLCFLGHNCFLDWLIIYDKFIDTLPAKLADFQAAMSSTFVGPIFDTKYLASEMKEHLFIRQSRPNISTYVDNFTTSTSLSSLYDLLTSQYYENLIFFKPAVDNNRYNDDVRVILSFPLAIVPHVPACRRTKLATMRSCPA